MLILTSNEQAEALIKNDVLDIDDDITIAFDGFCISANIKCQNIYSRDCQRDISAWDIEALYVATRNINARNIAATDISAQNINAGNINTGYLNAWNINALDITASVKIDAEDIKARNIDTENIRYEAFCCAYGNIKCSSIEAHRENHKHFCLDGEITVKGANK